MASIEGQKRESSGLRKWLPAAGLAIITVVVMIVMKFNPHLLDQAWENQKVALAGFYKENLQPVLTAANLSNEDIFNFAFNNELPLDDSRKQYLLLGYDDSGKEYFEIRSSDQKINRGSYKEFVTAMNLNDNQKQTVDSIINSYSPQAHRCHLEGFVGPLDYLAHLCLHQPCRRSYSNLRKARAG